MTPETPVPPGTPLVSVVVRSMGRPELKEALASIAAQWHPNIEILLVDARGKGELRVESHAGCVPVHLVRCDKPMPRAAAANAGIERAKGDFLLLLDEDDLIDPPHISSMLAALAERPEFLAAYCGIRIHHAPDAATDFLAEYSLEQLYRSNFLPIHAVLWSRQLIERGCRFDESFEIFEDWDFWLQVSQHTRFLLVNSVTGHWRAWAGHSGTGTGFAGNQDAKQIHLRKIESKWTSKATALRAQIRELLKEGRAKQGSNDPDGASACFRGVLALDPFDVSALNLLGMLELRAGRADSAVRHFEKAVAAQYSTTRREHAGLLFNLGIALQAAGRLEQARKSLARAVELDPAFEAARIRLNQLASE